MTVQFIEIAGQRMAVLPAADYDRLLDAAEDRADEAAAIAAEDRRDAGEEYLPAAMLDRILQGESGLRVWREHRGMTATKLAADAGVSQAAISKLELGQRGGRPDVWRSLANALRVSPADIMPGV